MTIFRNIIIITILTCLVLVVGCSNEVSNPTNTGDPGGGDDPGNNNGGGGDEIDYGRLYFQSDRNTRWLTTGAVTVSDGNIRAVNQTDSLTIGSCTLLDPIDFGSAIFVTFTWRESVNRSDLYSFWLSDTLDYWESRDFEQDSTGRMIYQLRFFMSMSMHCRFEFNLPPDANVALSDIRAYGKIE